MSLDRLSALNGEAQISEAFAEIARADNGGERLYIRTYVVDELVLIVTERAAVRAAPCDGASRCDPATRSPDLGAAQRRTAVEEVTGRHVTATVSGRVDEPEVNFELFVLAPNGSQLTRNGHFEDRTMR